MFLKIKDLRSEEYFLINVNQISEITGKIELRTGFGRTIIMSNNDRFLISEEEFKKIGDFNGI